MPKLLNGQRSKRAKAPAMMSLAPSASLEAGGNLLRTLLKQHKVLTWALASNQFRSYHYRYLPTSVSLAGVMAWES